MKRLSTLILLFFVIRSVHADCNLNPTITPAAPILCPNSTDTLWTEEYETYQWYKGNNPIAGATNQYYVITENDILKSFKVEVILDTCIATSPSVLVDGWIFLLPYVIHSGDLGNYDPQLDATILCARDTLILTMGLPYSVNVQWYDGNNPIPGATNAEYIVTQNGSYTACGAPAVCPDFIQCLGLYINVVFGGAPPSITIQNDTLYSSPAESYQWNLNGLRISGATNEWYSPSVNGIYTVTIVDEYGCKRRSDGYDYVARIAGAVALQLEIFPNPAHDFFSIYFTSLMDGSRILIHDLTGRMVYEEKISWNGDQYRNIDSGSWPAGIYVIELQSPSGLQIERIVKE